MKLLLLLICLFLSSCGVKNGNHLKQIMKDIDVYSDIYLLDTINTKNIEILNNNELIDTTKLGKKSYRLEYIYEDKKYYQDIDINIVDREAPRYFGSTYKTIVKDYDGDLCNLVMYGDNYDGNLTCKIEGNYDLNKVGTYKVVYEISDSSSNKTDISVTLNVIEKKNTNNNSSSNSSNNVTNNTLFSDIYEMHKNENTLIGIDVSKWQGDIDYTKVKEAKSEFVMIRIGVQTSINGELSVDSYFYDNIKNAKEAGLLVGVYLYSKASSEIDAINQAKWVVDILNKEELDLPIVFDWENWSSWNTYKLSFFDINNIANKFIDTVEDYGYEGMLYSSKYYLENIWTNKYNHLVWLAHYTNKTNYSGNYYMWQLCNDGSIDGIDGNVDINVLYQK